VGGGSPVAAGSCVLTPEQTEGPYYIDVGLVRSNITEGRPGVPLELNLMVQRAGTCQPIADAVVEIWHCDALGGYSGFAAETVQAQGESPTSPSPKPAFPGPKPGSAPPGGSQQPTNQLRFLRGGQATGRDGRVKFSTVYPGWYRGRTVHIHVKVHAGGNEVHTGQLYFDDALSNQVFARAPYSQHPNRDTTNANDGIYAQGGRQSIVDVKQNGSGMVGSITLTVQA
jgi:protocatechuate 3,4-dioxygenase beta subunit